MPIAKELRWNAEEIAVAYLRGDPLSEIYKHAYPGEVYSALRARKIPLRKPPLPLSRDPVSIIHGAISELSLLPEMLVQEDRERLEKALNDLREIGQSLFTR